jgi:hypothetical protein
MKHLMAALPLAAAAAALLAPAVSSASGTTVKPAKAPHSEHHCRFSSGAAV